MEHAVATRTEIEAEVINILQPLVSEEAGDNAEITESAHIVDDLNIHSIRLVDLVIELEDAFNIKLKDSDMKTLMGTVGNVVDLVSARISAK
jgi:acyl carrier protein